MATTLLYDVYLASCCEKKKIREDVISLCIALATAEMWILGNGRVIILYVVIHLFFMFNLEHFNSLKPTVFI